MKDIKGYEGLYAVTPEGQIWGYKQNRFKTLSDNKDGYKVVSLSKHGKIKSFLVHRLVAEAYIPNPEGKETVNHKREFEKWNNSIENLEWATRLENNNYGTRTKRATAACKKPVYCVELDKTYDCAANAAKELGIYATNITRVCKGRGKTYKGYHWMYVNKEN